MGCVTGLVHFRVICGKLSRVLELLPQFRYSVGDDPPEIWRPMVATTSTISTLPHLSVQTIVLQLSAAPSFDDLVAEVFVSLLNSFVSLR